MLVSMCSMFPRFSVLVTLMALLLGSSAAQSTDDVVELIESVEWMTEEYPPYNFVDPADGQLKGITVDVLMEMFGLIGARVEREDLLVLPWARSYSRLLKEPGTALFSTTYTEERLKLFQFVGPVIPTRVSVIAAKQGGVNVDSVQDLNQLRIGVVRDDVGEQLIRSLGVTDGAIEYSNYGDNMVRKLDKGRLDAISYAEDIASYQFKLAGIKTSKYETVLVLKDSHMGYAFHQSTDKRVVDTLQAALERLRAEGALERIYRQYLE